MVKVIAIADLHLKMVPGIEKSWLVERYRKFIDDIVARCESEGAVLAIAGDTADSTAMKKEELSLFMYLLHELAKRSITVLLVSGNHESLRKGQSYLDFLEVKQFPNVVYRENYTIDNVTFHLVNHDSIHEHEPNLSPDKFNILISHFRPTVGKFIKEEIDVKKFTEPYDICIVGDIHSELEIYNVVYPSMPLNKEFDQNPECGFLEIEIDTEITIKRIKTNYPNILGRKVSAKEFNPENYLTHDFYRIEVEGTADELKQIPEALPNAIINKVPVLTSVLTMSEVETVSDIEDFADEGLIKYFKELNYEDNLIGQLMTELRRQP